MAASVNKDCCITADFYWTALSLQLVFDISISLLGTRIGWPPYTITLVKSLIIGCRHLAEAGPGICLNVDAKCYADGKDGLGNIGLDECRQGTIAP